MHPDAGPRGSRREPLDASGHFDYLGLWSETKADDNAQLVDASVAAVADGSVPGWSGC